MKRLIGIDNHYPPISKVERWYLLGVPAVIALGYALGNAVGGFKLPDYLGAWIAVLIGLFVMGWVSLVFQRVVREFERSGYKTAMDDVTTALAGVFMKAQLERDTTVIDIDKRVAAELLSLQLSQPD